MKYRNKQEVYEALCLGTLKRTSAISSKRRYKQNNNKISYEIFNEGIKLFDLSKDLDICSYYNKPIDFLTLREVVNLYREDKMMFTKKHSIRFTILMIGESDDIKVKDYKGVIMNPSHCSM